MKYISDYIKFVGISIYTAQYSAFWCDLDKKCEDTAGVYWS